MNLFIYKESCPDHYPKTPTNREFIAQMQSVRMAQDYLLSFLYVDEKEGLKLIGVLDKIWETIKGFFGFENRTRAVLIKSEVLKLLHYGSTHGYLNQTFVNWHATIISTYLNSYTQNIQNIIPTISEKIKDKLIDLCTKHTTDLAPCFWNRFFIAPQIKESVIEKSGFGATHLTLAQQSQDHSTPLSTLQKIIKVVNAFSHNKKAAIRETRQGEIQQYEFALNAGNSSKTFQSLLRNQFKTFVKTKWGELEENQKQQVLSLILRLTSIALNERSYDKAEEYATFGLEHFQKNFALVMVKCQAQCAQDKEQDTSNQFQKLIKTCYKKNIATPNQKNEVLRTIQSLISKAKENKNINDVEKHCRLGLEYFPDHLEFNLTLCELFVDQNNYTELSNVFKNVCIIIQRSFVSIESSKKKRILSLIKSLCSMTGQAASTERGDVEKLATFGLTYFPEDIELHFIKVKAQVAQNKFEEANIKRQWLERFASELEGELLKPGTMDSKKNQSMKLIQIYSTLGQIDSQRVQHPSIFPNYEQATVYFKKAWNLDKTNTQLELKVFQCLMATYNRPETANIYLNTLANLISSANSTKRLSLLQEASGFIGGISQEDLQGLLSEFEHHEKYDKASELYEYGVKKWPEKKNWIISNQTNYAYALILASQQKSKEAFDIIDMLLKKDLKNKTYQQKLLSLAKNLGMTYTDQSKFESALEYFKQALTLNPSKSDEEEIKKEICSLYYTLAWESINKCLVSFDTELYHHASEWQEHKKTHAKDLEQALKHYNQAISYEPNNSALYFEKAELLNFFQMEEESDLKSYELAVQYNPERPFYLLRLAEIYKDLKNDTMAEKYENKAIKLQGGISNAYLKWYDDRFQMNKGNNIDPHKFE